MALRFQVYFYIVKRDYNILYSSTDGQFKHNSVASRANACHRELFQVVVVFTEPEGSSSASMAFV